MSNVEYLPRRPDPRARRRRSTATSAFGVGRREGHDATAFYARFATPELSGDDTVVPPAVRDRIWVGDARQMDAAGDVADGSVALVVTSPPYFAGKEYETALGEGHVPASYRDYLDMLHAVLAECRRKLEPGGRIAVNVANLGRKPYRSLAGDIVAVLEDLGFLLRGEIVWRKQLGASGSCAWGSYRSPANPVLRDTTERVIVAGKGRFDRARSPAQRRAAGLPHEATITMDEFVDATLDVWEIPAESATRVGHPAPFPVELPRRLIELYTYRGDLVLDPFMGVGSTAVAAVRTGRHYVGFDTDAAYAARAEERIAEERERRAAAAATAPGGDRRAVAAVAASSDGEKAVTVARRALEAAGFRDVEDGVTFRRLGVEVTFAARDANGDRWLFDLAGGFSATRPGLRRPDVLWRALGRASVLHGARRQGTEEGLGPFVLLSVDMPVPNSAGDRALRQVLAEPAGPVHGVVGLLDDDTAARLAAWASGGRRPSP